jgi:hypothetical protein
MGYHDSTGRYRATEQAFLLVEHRSFHLAAGTPLAAFADGDSVTPGLALDNSEAAGVRWNNHATPAAIWGSLALPQDRVPDTDVIVHIVASKTGATANDATTFTVGAFFHPVAALRDADATAGGASSAMTGAAATKTVQKVTRTIAAADIPDPVAVTDVCAVLSLSLKPTDATLGVDDVTIHAVFLEYTRQDLTA